MSPPPTKGKPPSPGGSSFSKSEIRLYSETFVAFHSSFTAEFFGPRLSQSTTKYSPPSFSQSGFSASVGKMYHAPSESVPFPYIYRNYIYRNSAKWCQTGWMPAVDLLLGQIMTVRARRSRWSCELFLKSCLCPFAVTPITGLLRHPQTVDEPCAFRSTDARRTTRPSPPGFPSPHACLVA